MEEVPLGPIKDGLLHERVRYTALDKPAVDVRVIAIIPGLERAIVCEATLFADETSAADRVEALCVGALSQL